MKINKSKSYCGKMRYLLLLLCFSFLSCQGQRPKSLGLNKADMLAPCPKTPNCVVSYYKENDPKHFIEPITIHEDRETAYNKLASIIQTSSGAKLIKREKDYLYAEFTSSLFKFVDDVEFYFSKKEKKIFIRSASRTGRSDFGVNKKRIATIRFRFQQNDYIK